MILQEIDESGELAQEKAAVRSGENQAEGENSRVSMDERLVQLKEKWRDNTPC